MFKKIISDLRKCADFNYCSECYVDGCTAGDFPDREACVFNLAANIIESLEKENKGLQKKVSELEKKCKVEQLNAAYAITELVEAKRMFLSRIEATINTVSKWTSAKERMPEK